MGWPRSYIHYVKYTHEFEFQSLENVAVEEDDGSADSDLQRYPKYSEISDLARLFAAASQWGIGRAKFRERMLTQMGTDQAIPGSKERRKRGRGRK